MIDSNSFGCYDAFCTYDKKKIIITINGIQKECSNDN